MSNTSERHDFTVELEVKIFVDPTKTFTVANIVSFDEEGKLLEGIGVAKRNAEDKYDANEGWGLATKRALIDLADKFSEY